MQYRIQENCKNIDWLAVYRVLQEAGMASHTLEETQKAFENSYRVVFVFDKDLLMGVGRAISDGSYEAGIFDVAVLPDYRGKKIGKLIMAELHKGLPNINVILYAKPEAQSFYKKIGYSKMLTGMAKFAREDRMREKGYTD